MWDDRFLFVLATLASITACIFLRQDRGVIQTSRVSNVVARWIIFSLIMTLIVAIICARVWTYRNDLTVPNLGSAIAVLIGVVFGSFTAKFVASLFGSQFGRRDPIIGAAVLVTGKRGVQPSAVFECNLEPAQRHWRVHGQDTILGADGA
jgi:hypothetical protein